MVEPGLDKHEWESRWQHFEEDIETSPAEALSELDGLTVEMLECPWLCDRRFRSP